MLNPEHAGRAAGSAVPRVEYMRLGPGADAGSLPADALAAIVFGPRSRSGPPPPSPAGRSAIRSSSPDPRVIHVGLEPLEPPGIVELWRAGGPVRTGRDGPIRFAADREFLAGVIELDEREHGGLASAAEWAYASIRHFQARSDHPHLLRMWNYFEGINRGRGDDERYRQFCLGRAAGFGPGASVAADTARDRGSARACGPHAVHRFPAGTAIGRRDDSPILQVYWLAGRTPGSPLENPRQLSAFRYPRRYGPAPPSFSRAMLVSRQLLISGTASIVGHASRHAGSLERQLDETLVNLESMVERAVAMQPAVLRRWGAHTLLKVYLRDGSAAESAARRLSERLLPGVQWLMLEADICRAELLVEIDCAHGS
jgi:chorismate lyase/3-hydroxybenzoate synthase